MTSVSCASSTSTHKSQRNDNRSKSSDTVCTSNSSCILQRRKPMNPLAYSMRPVLTKPTNTVKQRVLSAKLLKLRSIQNKLNDANFHLAEVSRENQALKVLQQRQDKALAKYENTNAELPRLLHSHEEEIRVLSEKNKTLRKNLKDLTEQLKLKEDELKKIREQLSHYEKLNKNKHLMEREKLMDQLEDLKVKLQKSDEQVCILNRKVMLEGKTCKQRLNNEITKHRQCQRDLIQALEEIDRLTGVLETKENTAYPRNRLSKLAHRQSLSMVGLDTFRANRVPSKDRLHTIKDEIPKTPVTDVKLEPIGNKRDDLTKNSNSLFKPPIESIKNRLSGSGGSLRSKELHEPDIDVLNTNHNIPSSENLEDSRLTSASSTKSRPHSSIKLEKLPRELVTKSTTNSAETVKLSFSPETGQGEPSTSIMNPEEDTGTSDIDDGIAEDFTSILVPKDKRKAQILYSNNRPSSGEKFQELSDALDSALEKAARNGCDEFDKKLGNYCSEVVKNVRNCHDVIESHKEELAKSKHETESIEETFRKTESLESKLKQSFFSFDDDDMGIVKDILSEEFKFQATASKNKMDIDKVREKDQKIKAENKKKLLATLKAIDNGESFDSLENSPPPRRTSTMNELFSEISQ